MPRGVPNKKKDEEEVSRQPCSLCHGAGLGPDKRLCPQCNGGREKKPWEV